MINELFASKEPKTNPSFELGVFRHPLDTWALGKTFVLGGLANHLAQMNRLQIPNAVMHAELSRIAPRASIIHAVHNANTLKRVGITPVSTQRVELVGGFHASISDRIGRISALATALLQTAGSKAA